MAQEQHLLSSRSLAGTTKFGLPVGSHIKDKMQANCHPRHLSKVGLAIFI
jgi:hypothetical protein